MSGGQLINSIINNFVKINFNYKYCLSIIKYIYNKRSSFKEG